MDQCWPPLCAELLLQPRSDLTPNVRRTEAQRQGVEAIAVLPYPIDVADDQILAVAIRGLRKITDDASDDVKSLSRGIDLVDNPFHFTGLSAGPDNDDSSLRHLAAAP